MEMTVTMRQTTAVTMTIDYFKETDKIWYCNDPLKNNKIKYINDCNFKGAKTYTAVYREINVYQNYRCKPN